MSRRTEFAASARLDLMDALRSRWVVSNGVLYAILATVFVFVAMRESNVMGFTGTTRVLMSFAHALLLLLPLLSLIATGSSLNRSREDGALELLFSHPLAPGDYYLAVTSVRFVLVAGPLVVIMLAMPLYARVAFGDDVPWVFVFRSLVVCVSLAWCFTGIGMFVSIWVSSPARAMTYALLIWAASVALLDFVLIGLMLRWRLNAQAVFLLASLNPVQASRMALLAFADPELSVLGPVGFYLAGKIGTAKLFVLGSAWPCVCGAAAWWLGRRAFRNGDLV
ncbi:MAG: ABC transporter permease subunit [Deltaproteobacteria bacterium]|nr:ABC transporter permease subunit [Deltaproteobacteria bacterium]